VELDGVFGMAWRSLITMDVIGVRDNMPGNQCLTPVSCAVVTKSRDQAEGSTRSLRASNLCSRKIRKSLSSMNSRRLTAILVEICQ
jgi:hypothetical protein